MSSSTLTARRRSGSFQEKVDTRTRHDHDQFARPFSPPKPLTSGFSTPPLAGSWEQRNDQPRVKFWLRWAVYPASAVPLLLAPILLYALWEFLAPALRRSHIPLLDSYLGPYSRHIPISNPFAPFFLLSGYVTSSQPDDPRYQKSYSDLLFVAYYIVFFSLVRQVIAIDICQPLARYFGIKKADKLTRFGEQGHGLVYWSLMSVWGFRIMRQLPTYWYQTEHFWIDYPHWDMKPELKCYYLLQLAFWVQQMLVLVLGLEKPRKDYWAYVIHHFVTIWLVGCSYVMNLTLIGNAVFLSMDIPDTFLSFSKLLNYMRWGKAKTVAFAAFVPIWTYFRHILNWSILWSLWYETKQMPGDSRRWAPEEGLYMSWGMKRQIFSALFSLQVVQLYWFYLILRVLYRSLVTAITTDVRSDDEDDD